MATMIIGGEKLQMPVWMKARLLEVTLGEDINLLNVESGSERGKVYPVRHDGTHATSCPCRATIAKCAHMLAAEKYLALASDVQVHLDDMAEDEDEQSMGAQAEQIIAAEYEAKARAEAEAINATENIDADPMDATAAMQAEKARKLAAQEAYREAYPNDFSDYCGYAA